MEIKPLPKIPELLEICKLLPGNLLNWVELELSGSLFGTLLAKSIQMDTRMFAGIMPSDKKHHFHIWNVNPQGTGIRSKQPVHGAHTIDFLVSINANVQREDWKIRKYAAHDDIFLKPTLDQTRVYFISGAGLIKIGFSIDPQLRLEKMQCGSPIPLKLLATTNGGHKLEKVLHKRFAKDRQHGEWFEPSKELLTIINECQGRNRFLNPETNNLMKVWLHIENEGEYTNAT